MTPHHIARKRFGQHFLTDESVIHAIIALIHPQNGDRLIEIGPGLGALTLPLLSFGQPLTLIELDRDLVERWQRHPQREHLTILAQDVLTVDFHRFEAPWRLIGNLPYNISTPLLFHLANYADRMHDSHFMLQKEVVDRLVASPGQSDYGRLSVMLQYHFHMASLLLVEPESFNPPPKVRSAIVRLIPRCAEEKPASNPTTLSAIVTGAFAQRRKMLRSSLKGLLSASALHAVGIDPERRGETLSLEEFCRLSLIAAF